MTKVYLDPKRTIGIEPAADDQNVEAVGDSCLDINEMTAYLGKGGVHGGVFAFFFAVVSMVAVDLYLVLFEGWTVSQFPITGHLAAIACFALVAVLAASFPFLHSWRTRVPLRFNRKTHKVYYHRKGKTSVTDWDKIRAYLSVQSSPVPYRGVIRDPLVNIEFQRENGAIFVVQLRGADSVVGDTLIGKTDYEKAAELWEYIRVYMENGPRALPELRRSAGATDLRGFFELDNPFPIISEMTLSGIVLGPIFFPLRVFNFLIAFPANVIYYCYLIKRIKGPPFPPDMIDACLTNAERKKRRAEEAATAQRRIEENMEQIEVNSKQIPLLVLSLTATYKAWFVDFHFPGHEGVNVVDGLSEGWFRVPLTDLVQLNPTEVLEADDEISFLPLRALPENGLLIERSPFERCAAPTPVRFRNYDTLVPVASPLLESGERGLVLCLRDDEIACGSEEWLVLRAQKVSAEFTYCLASHPALREYARRASVESVGGHRPTALANFAIPMPPLRLLIRFEDEHVRPCFKKIMDLLAENERLRQERNQLARQLEYTSKVQAEDKRV